MNDYQALLLAQQQRNKEEVLPNIQVVRRRPHVGELEDDNDMPGLNDITDKLNQFGNQLNRLEVKVRDISPIVVMVALIVALCIRRPFTQTSQWTTCATCYGTDPTPPLPL